MGRFEHIWIYLDPLVPAGHLTEVVPAYSNEEGPELLMFDMFDVCIGPWVPKLHCTPAFKLCFNAGVFIVAKLQQFSCARLFRFRFYPASLW